jgi:hypothetical protein
MREANKRSSIQSHYTQILDIAEKTHSGKLTPTNLLPLPATKELITLTPDYIKAVKTNERFQ